MNSKNPRRPSSRGTTPRPRKLAGQDRASAEESRESASSAGASSRSAPTGAKSAALVKERKPASRPSDRAPESSPPRTPILAARKMTQGLLVGLTVIALVLVGEAAWAYFGEEDREAAASVEETLPEAGAIEMNASDAQSGADAAAKALIDIVARKSASYDDDIAKASELMTERFAAEYRDTTDQIRDEFVANRTDVQARVVAQGVVRASRSSMDVLVFLNQYITKGAKGEERTTYAPYRAVVTVVNTDRGWLVDGLATK